MQHMTLTAEACFQKKRRYLRVDFHVVSEADVVDDMVSELMPVKGCKRTEAAIHRHILSRQDVVILCAHLVWNLQSIAQHKKYTHMYRVSQMYRVYRMSTVRLRYVYGMLTVLPNQQSL